MSAATAVERGPEGLGGLDLGSDVHADPDRIEVSRSLDFLVHRPGGLDVDSELVLAQAGRYIRMSLGKDVRVDPQGDPGPDAPLARPLGQQGHLRFTLHIEDQNAGSKSKIDLRRCLAHTRKHHSASGLLIHLEDALKLSAGDDIESRTPTRKQLENRKIGVCLHRIANEVIPMGKCIGEKPISIEYLPCGIDIQRGPIFLGQRKQRNTLTMQCRFAFGIVEGTVGESGLGFQKREASHEWSR